MHAVLSRFENLMNEPFSVSPDRMDLIQLDNLIATLTADVDAYSELTQSSHRSLLPMVTR